MTLGLKIFSQQHILGDVVLEKQECVIGSQAVHKRVYITLQLET